MRRAALLLVLLVAACGPSPTQIGPTPTGPTQAGPSSAGPSPAGPSPADAKANANPEKYARDRDTCRAQVDDYMKTRRNIDDSRREVFAGNYERYGQTTLPTDMANYDDSRRSDRLVANCMESLGWPQPQRSWWQR